MMDQYNLLKNRANSEKPLLTKKKQRNLGNKILSCFIFIGLYLASISV